MQMLSDLSADDLAQFEHIAGFRRPFLSSRFCARFVALTNHDI
jgi:hypothetical protein